MTQKRLDPSVEFVAAILDDATVARERFLSSDTPSHRRDLIRTTFFATEGLLWRVKEMILTYADRVPEFSPYDIAALREETYTVEQNGTTKTQPRFLPTTTSIKLAFRSVKRFSPQFDVDYSAPGWIALTRSINVRNRLVHPKEVVDLSVKNCEISDCILAQTWFIATANTAIQCLSDYQETVIAELHAEHLKISGKELPRPLSSSNTTPPQ